MPHKLAVDPSAAAPANIYKLLIGTVASRPIALASTLSLDGSPNLVPFS